MNTSLALFLAGFSSLWLPVQELSCKNVFSECVYDKISEFLKSATNLDPDLMDKERFMI